jgi:hypothetical protein
MSSLSSTIGRYIPGVRKKPSVSKQEILGVRPVRHALVAWTRSEDEVTLVIPMRDDRLAKVLGRIFKVPKERKIVLDEVGSAVWELCDGERDINAIVVDVCKKYKLSRREAEASISSYLKILAQKNLIGLVSGGKKTSDKTTRP